METLAAGSNLLPKASPKCGQVGWGFLLLKLLNNDGFFHSITGERELRARIKDLMRYRKNGITKLAGNSMSLEVTRIYVFHHNSCYLLFRPDELPKLVCLVFRMSRVR